MAELRMAIVGSGYMGRTHAECITRHVGRARLVAIAGGRRAPGLARDYGVDCEAGYEALLRRSPDPAGRAFWVARLAAGGNLVDLLFSVAATAEYAAQTPRSSGPDVLAIAFD